MNMESVRGNTERGRFAKRAWGEGVVQQWVGGRGVGRGAGELGEPLRRFILPLMQNHFLHINS